MQAGDAMDSAAERLRCALPSRRLKAGLSREADQISLRRHAEELERRARAPRLVDPGPLASPNYGRVSRP